MPDYTLLTRYWDTINFNDKRVVEDPEVLLKPTLDFFSLLEKAGVEKDSAIAVFMDKLLTSDSLTFDYMANQVIDKYLCSAGSPMRNDYSCRRMLKYLIQDNRIQPASKSRMSELVNLLEQNEPGFKAHSFEMVTRNGQHLQLNELSPVPTVVFFNNPDCESCRLTTLQLIQSPSLNKALQQKEIQLIAVHVDYNIAGWKTARFPDTWLSVYAQNPDSLNQLYDLRAIPSLYLLDREQRVVIKDGLAEEILSAIEKKIKL